MGTETSVKLQMNSPKATTVDINHYHGFESPVLVRIENAIDSSVSIDQIQPKTSPMDICIHEGNDKNIVQIGQIKPILSAIQQSSTLCIPTDSIISNETSETQTTIEAPNDEAVVSENDVSTSEISIQEVPLTTQVSDTA